MNNTQLLQQGFWAFLATAGFGVLFNVPTRMLAICGFTGAMGHMWRRALLANDVHPVVATFIGALVVGLLGYSQARFFHVPRLIFTVTGIIPMVPGVPAFETIVYFLRDDITTGLENAVLVGLLVGAISAGLITARLVVSLGDTAYTHTTRGLWQRD
jgi:uncharacterized membrane protein YjjB (DUF3815 family)